MIAPLKVALLLLSLLITSLLSASPPFFPTFTPPTGWLLADPSKLEEGVQVGFIESKRRLFSPSISLTLESVGDIDLKNYLEAVKTHYRADRTNRCRELGILDTSLGKATILQIEMENQWGEIRILQAISLHAGHVIIQTAASLKEDFARVQELFLSTFKSLSVYPTLFDSIDSPQFESKVKTMMTCWNKYCDSSRDDRATLFASSFFQSNQWRPLVNFIEREYAAQGPCWQFLAIKHLKESLMENVK